ncbi:D-Ala-D-Ala carboxypeptidase family metallohydrolase [Sphingomonas sp.]|jgi:uncharacterized protein YcbK (DUF882 family)|uniref:D-Ala-D-Ala carboxypeptidase family metallohydrolase n=1 Tax=Sphingomonas sp. TaxID=28214 RepID=UPI0026023481|nr:D-Ala-D-Ala carboxypeptidase family metallohydrolase [Sphingomonas sp.]MDF2493286.1 hypothetical protein [Sphingomonas sp.]
MADSSNVFPLVLSVREDGSINSAMAGFEDSIRIGAVRAGGHLDAFGQKYRRLRDDMAKTTADPLGISSQLRSLSSSPFQLVINQQLAASNALAAQQARLAQSNGLVATSAGAQRAAYVQLGQQLQDSIIQAQMGTSAFTILAQQGSQAAVGFVNFGGKVGAAAQILAGWQGAVLLAGIALAGNLVPALLRSGAASDEAKKALEKHRQAMLDLAQAQDDALRTAERKQAVDTANLQNEYNQAVAVRNTTQTLLEKAQALARLNAEMARSPPGSSDEAIEKDRQLGSAESRITELNMLLAKNQSEVDRLKRGFESGYSRLVTMKVEARSTPAGAVQSDFERELSRTRRDPAYRGTANSDKLAAKVQELIAARDRELKAVNDAEAAQRKLTSKVSTTASDLPTATQISNALREAFPGVRITSTTRTRAENAAVKGAKNSHHLAGLAVDFVPPAGVSKADVRKALETRGLSISELLGPGDKGHADHFHVAVTKGAAALQDFTVAQRDAAQAQRELDQTLESITARFDPARAAATDYANALDQIATLQAKGQITPGTGFDLQMKVIRAQQADQAAAFDQAFRTTFGDGIGEAINEWQQGITAGAVAASEELTGGVRGAVNELRFAASGIADLLGIQVNGPARRLLQNGGIEGQAGDIAEAVSKAIRTTGVKFDDNAQAKLASVIAGAGYGQVGSQIYSGLSGRAGNGTLGAVSGILGNEGGMALRSTIATAVGGTLGKTLGSAAGPLGAIAAGILGNVVGGLFRTVKYGTASVSQNGASIAGNSSSARGAAGNLGDSVAQGVQRIVDQFGGTMGNYNVSIGQFDGKYRVSTTGFKGSLDSKKAKGQGLVDFGTDGAEAAIRFAIADAIKDGAVQGLRAGTQRLIQLGNDVEVQLQKALQFESVFTQLRQLKDPIGAAAEAIEKEFANLRKIFDEAGATSEERAQLEELYAIKRTEAIKQAQESAISQLKDLLDDLKQGDNGLSLRSRETNILQTFSPLMEAIQRGEKVNQEDFTSGARTYLDVQRQLYGSTNPYFEALAKITALTSQAIANSGAGANVASLLNGNTQQAALAAAGASGGSMPASSVDVTGMVTAVRSQTDVLVDALAANTAGTNARLDLIAKQLAQQGSPMVLQLAGGGGLAQVNALRNA